MYIMGNGQLFQEGKKTLKLLRPCKHMFRQPIDETLAKPATEYGLVGDLGNAYYHYQGPMT